MHVFLLILTVTGQPERIAAVCDTYRQCSDKGADLVTQYEQIFHKQPAEFSYRVVPGTVTKR
jgi:hypothetical protein